MCVATAEFVAGPIRSRIGIEGVASAERRNLNNDCPYFRRKILETPKIRDLKAWVRRDLNGQEGKLGDYSVNYKIHGFLADSGKYFMTSSRLNGCVMDILHRNKIEIASPAIMNQRRTDDFRFIPPAETQVNQSEADHNPELLVFDEAIESAKTEEKKVLLEKMKTKRKELQEKIKDTEDASEVSRLESSLSHLESLIKRTSADLGLEEK